MRLFGLNSFFGLVFAPLLAGCFFMPGLCGGGRVTTLRQGFVWRAPLQEGSFFSLKGKNRHNFWNKN